MRTILLLVLVMTINFQKSHANNENRVDRKSSLMVQRSRYVVEMSEDSIARKMSLDKLKALATQNNSEAYNALGILYLYGKGLPKDTLKAFDMFKKSAELGLKDGMCNIGKLYREGKGGVERNYTEAFKYYKMAADAGHHLATYSLARSYYRGEGVEKNFDIAYPLYKKAASFNIPVAKFRVGTCTFSGKGVVQDKEKGIAIVKEVYNEGLTKAERFFKYNKIPYDKKQ
ncbi:sel1 repeat family protein [Halosquirtibacter xylanolyticus]|uniref:tetratricopeptide repeat protein n=1 Tax=Halosquirtibacter xylanolyticus TaxID=3374599 RepID=UPI003748B757|nr:sel1 repeat family protein [Prolixibacteraceae bacterium]